MNRDRMFIMIGKLTAVLLCIPFFCACTEQGAWDLLRESGLPVTVTFQEGANGYAGTKDAHLIEWHSDNNTGANIEIEATKHTGITPTDNKAIVIEFDVSSIPSAATVIDAELSLLLISQRNGGNPKTLNIHRITAAWAEGNGTGIDGANVPGVDWSGMPAYDALSIDDQLITTTVDTWFSFDIISAVQSWVSSPSLNYGVILIEDIPINSDGTKVFASSEHSTQSSRPRLTVTYIK